MLLFRLRKYKEPNKISSGEIIGEVLNLNTSFKLCNVAGVKIVLPDYRILNSCLWRQFHYQLCSYSLEIAFIP